MPALNINSLGVPFETHSQRVGRERREAREIAATGLYPMERCAAAIEAMETPQQRKNRLARVRRALNKSAA